MRRASRRLIVITLIGAVAILARLRPTSDPATIEPATTTVRRMDLPSWTYPATKVSDPDPTARTAELVGPPEKTIKMGPSGAMKALQYWSAQRAYPGEVLPAAKFGAALDEVRGLAARDASGRDSLVAPWDAIGPANVGGRTLCLALHPLDPDVMFAGSASGGLWKTTTGGVGASAWEYVDVGDAVLGVSTIAIDPTDPDVMYIGTGEAYDYQSSIGGDTIRTTRGSYGVGILKTIDGGLTWSPSLDWTYQQSRGVWMIQIHPTDGNILYAATTEGIYKSIDAGGSWNRVHDVIMAMDVRIHPTRPDTLFAAHGNFGSVGHGIYRSTDAGLSWNRLAIGLPPSWTGKCQLAIAKTAPDTIFASISHVFAGRGLYRSVNGGDAWSRINGTDYQQFQGWYSHYVVVSPFDDQTLFTGGIEISRSTDGGSTLTVQSNWQDVYLGTSPPEGPLGDPQYAHADHHFAVWHPTQPNTVFFTSDGGVFRTTDLGVTFESLIGGYQTGQFYNGFSNSSSDRDFAMGGLQDNFTVIYEGTGAWRRVIGGDGAWTAIHPEIGSTLYGSAQGLFMLRSYDTGTDWVEIPPPQLPGDVTAFIAPFVLSPAEPATLFAGRAHVYRSDDEGSSWTPTNGAAPLSAGNPVISMAIAQTTSDVVYAATAPISGRARVFRTRDRGGSWVDVSTGLPDRYPSDLAVNPHDPDEVYVTLMGFGSSHVFKSTDGGDSWIDIGAGLPDIPTSAIEVDPDSTDFLYVGTDLGIYLSIDGGGSWEPFTDGMPLAMVNDLKVFLPDRKLRAATHGNGAYERDLYDPSILRGDDIQVPLPVIAQATLPWVDPDPVLTAPFADLLFYQVEGADRILLERTGTSVTLSP